MTLPPGRSWRATFSIASVAALIALTLRIDGVAHPGPAGVTWTAAIAPILERRCVTCHGAAGSAIPRLDDYESARAASAAIKQAVFSRHLPGWHAAPGIRGFANDRAPSPHEAELLAQWADARAPRGDAVAPVVRNSVAELEAGLVLAAAGKHRIDSESHTFVLPTGLDAAAWLRGWRVEPGNAPLVTGAVLALAAGRTLGTWTAGEGATFLPEGVAIRLPEKAVVHLTVFYRRAKGPAVDASRVTLYFADGPQRGVESRTIGCGATSINSPMQALALRPIPAAGAPISLSVRAGGRMQPLARFDTVARGHTQTYWLDEPIALAPGASLDIESDAGRCAVEVVYVAGAAPLAPRATPAVVAAVSGGTRYSCPMHPDVTADAPGSCSRCAMALVPGQPRVTGTYRLDAKLLHERGRRGGSSKLRLTVREPGGGPPVRAFETMHERPFHLFAVSADLEDFAHLHPIATADGALEVPFAPSRVGAYRLFADFLPRGGTPQLIGRAVVAGRGRASPLEPRGEPPLDSVRKTAGDMRIEIRPDSAMRAGDPSLVAFRLSDALSGEPISDLDPFLGAWGHVFIVSSTLEDAVHSHPTAPLSAVPTGEVFFSQRFPRAGVYRLWAQFMRRGQLATVSFTLRVS